MSRLHLLILWILAFGAGFLFLKSKRNLSAPASTTKLETGSPIFAANLVDSIDEFKIEKGEKIVTLKKNKDQWVVVEQDNFPASLNTVTRMLDALRGIKVSQGVIASDEYYDRFNLDPSVTNSDEAPDSITLMTGGKESDKLYLGNSRQATGGTGKTAGRFVRLASDDSGVYIIQHAFASIDGLPSNWIDKSLSPLEERAIKIQVSAPNDEGFKTWSISRKTVMDDFLIDGLTKAEKTKIDQTSPLKEFLSNATFLELISAEDAQKRGDQKGTREIKATDSAGSSFLITATPEKQEEKTADEKDPDKPTPAAVSNYLVTVKILNGPTKPDAPAADASTQDKAVFEQRIANLADLSTSVNRMRARLEGRYFLVNKTTLASVLRNRGEFIQLKKVVKPKATVTTKPIQVPAPGSAPTTSSRLSVPGQASAPPPSLARPKATPLKKPTAAATSKPVQAPSKQPKFNSQNLPPLPGSRPAPQKANEAPKVKETPKVKQASKAEEPSRIEKVPKPE